jgi:SAM-dependent methyltransferase
MLHDDRRRAGSFGEDPWLYDRVRPRYPTELVDRLLARRPQRVLDVGCGTGIAGVLFAERGCTVLGVEPDPRMAAVAREHGLEVQEATFEAWEPAGRTFDLLISGQAWHWVEPTQGAAKAAAVLDPGAGIGLFWNQGRPGGDVGAALDVVYRRVAPGLEDYSILLRNLDTERFQAAAAAVDATGSFVASGITTYGWSRSYTREAWLDHLMSHSDHRTLSPETRTILLDGIGSVIDRFGGSIEVDYTCWLVEATRR